jgi:hypothetical protein
VKGEGSDDSLTFERPPRQSADTFEIISTQEDGIAFRCDCAHAGARSPNYKEMKTFLKPLAKKLFDRTGDWQREVLNALQKKPKLAADCRLFVDTWPKDAGEYHHGESCDQIYYAWPSKKKPKILDV